MVLTKIKESGRPILVVMNKTDQVKDKDLLMPHIQWLSEQGDFIGIVPISAKQGKNADIIKDEVHSVCRPVNSTSLKIMSPTVQCVLWPPKLCVKS